MRIRPLAAVSVAAVSLMLLAGCSSTTDAEPEESAPTDAVIDLCDAAAPSGAATDALSVDGEVGAESTLTFDAPVEVDELQRAVVTEGSGDAVTSGEFVTYALSAFDAETGDSLGSIGYGDDAILPQQIAAENPLGQLLGCATPGTRVVAAFPAASEDTPAELYIIDLLGVVPTAAWGEPQSPVDGMPTVELAEDGAPTITIPDAEAPTDVEIETLKKGDGEVVAEGDTVLVQYTGVKWSDGSIFDSSWLNGAPTSFQTTGVVEGFKQALEGQTVGSQVVAVIPPEFGYGDVEGNELQEETLVFVVDILGTQHAL